MSNPRRTLLAPTMLATATAMFAPPLMAQPADPAIAYVATYRSQGQYRWDVTVMNADGTNRRVIWSHISWIDYVAWSPDLDGNPGNGYQGTLAIEGQAPSSHTLWLLDVVVVGGVPQGTNLRVLIDGSVDPISSIQLSPEWSPDLDASTPGYQGKIAFEGYDPASVPSTYSINVMPMFWDGATAQPVNGPNSSELLYSAPPNTGVGHATWSPDGARIAVKLGGVGVLVLDAASGAVLTTISGTTGPSDGCNWRRTPGSSVIALRNADQLHTMDVDIGISSLQPMPAAPCADRHPTWSPDDRYIVFSGIDCGNKKLFTIRRTDVLTGQVTTLAAESGKNLLVPDWRRF